MPYFGKRGARAVTAFSEQRPGIPTSSPPFPPPNYALPKTAPKPNLNSSKMSGVVKLVNLACYTENSKGSNEKEVSSAGDNKSKSIE